MSNPIAAALEAAKQAGVPVERGSVGDDNEAIHCANISRGLVKAGWSIITEQTKYGVAVTMERRIERVQKAEGQGDTELAALTAAMRGMK